MQVKDIMCEDVKFININNTAQQAAMMMRTGNYGALPVEDKGRLAGMVTDRDLTLRVVAEGQDSQTVKVGEFMSKGINYCYEDQELGDVCDSMAHLKNRRLPVLSRDKKLVGIVSIVDMARNEESLTATHEVLRQVKH